MLAPSEVVGVLNKHSKPNTTLFVINMQVTVPGGCAGGAGVQDGSQSSAMKPRLDRPSERCLVYLLASRGGCHDRTLYADYPPPSLLEFGWEVPDLGRLWAPKENFA